MEGSLGHNEEVEYDGGGDRLAEELHQFEMDLAKAIAVLVVVVKDQVEAAATDFTTVIRPKK